MALSPILPGSRPNLFSQIADRLLGGPSNQSSDKQLLKDLEERYERAKMDRRALESQWLLNLAMYMGQQWLQWDQAARTLQRPNVPPWRVLAVANYVRQVILQAFGRVTHNRPQAKTQPADDSPEAEEASRAADKVLDYLWNKTASKKAIDKALMWALICGTGLVKACWDSASGDVIGNDPETNAPLHMGEIAVYTVSPFEFYPEPNTQELEEMTWLFHSTLRSASWVRERYKDPETGQPVNMEDENYQQTEVFAAQLRNITNGGEQHGGTPKGVVVKEYWERPNTQYPEGRYVVYAQDKVLYQGPNPYKHVPLPFLPLRGEIVVGRFWGEAMVTDLIDSQRNYNKSRSQAIEVRNLMAKPKWRIPVGSLPPGKDITSAPGEQIKYNPINGLKPEPIPGEPIPPSFFQDQSSSLRELYDLSAQHPIGFGTTGVRSALAIAYLQEQDNTRLGPLAGDYQEMIENLEAYKLLLAKQFYTEQRTVTVVGKENAVEVVHFRAETIPSDVTVRVQAGAALPMSRVARQQFLLQLAQTTIAPNAVINDPKRLLQLMEFGDIEGLYDDVSQDIRQAERENELMKQGQQIQPRDFHNHQVHTKEHNQYRKGEEYEQADPAAQQVFDQHVALHTQMWMQQVAQQAQMQQSLQGPPQAGTQSTYGKDFHIGGNGNEQAHESKPNANQSVVRSGPEAGQSDAYGARIERMANEGVGDGGA